MRKRRVEVTLDPDVVDALEGADLSMVVNSAIRKAVEAVEAVAHRRAVLAWMDELNARHGHPTAEQVAEAEALAGERGLPPRTDLGAA